MDYYDDNPLKVNRQNNLLTNLKQTRKEERKARKALKAQRIAEILIEQEKQRELDIKFQEIAKKENLKKCEIFTVRDQFNWEEIEEEPNIDWFDFTGILKMCKSFNISAIHRWSFICCNKSWFMFYIV